MGDPVARPLLFPFVRCVIGRARIRNIGVVPDHDQPTSCHGPDESAWTRVARAARAQHGVVSASQLAALGVDRNRLAHAVRTDRLRRVTHAVYASPAPLSWDARCIAAVLSSGAGAVLSHGAAAALWDIRPTSSPRIDVTVRTAGGRGRTDRRIHRHPSMGDDETATRRAIPVTSPARTLLDLASVLPPDALRRAVAQAEVVSRFDLAAIGTLLRRHPRHRGTVALRSVVAAWRPPPKTRSPLEDRFADLCDREALPAPETNAVVLGMEIDAVFPRHAVAVELDSHRFHRTRIAFEEDRRRSAILTARGWRTVRFTASHVDDDGGRFAIDILRELLGVRPAVRS